MTISESVKNIIRRILRIIITSVLILLSIILLILLLIQTGPVQNYGRRKLEAYLENKLQTRVRIGRLNIGFPTRIILENIYLEDRRKDTLISGGKIELEIGMLMLLKREVQVSHLELEDLTLKLKRQMPDSVFNFQFLVDAFKSGTKDPQKENDTTGQYQFVIGTIQFHHIHLVYADDATGNDLNMNLGDFETRLKTFDPAYQLYNIPVITLTDVSVRLRQYHPILILQDIADTISAHNKNAKPVKLELGDIDFTRIKLIYRNDAQNMDASVNLGRFHGRPDDIDFATLHIKLNQILLDSTIADIHYGKLAVVPTKKVVAVKDTITHAGNWSLDISKFNIDHSRLKYDDDNKTPLQRGMDYNHLHVNNLQVQSENLHADPNNYQVHVSAITFEDKSGFVLKKLSGKLSFSNHNASLKDLVIQTSRSEIRSQTSIEYRSLEELKKHPGDMETNLVLDRARIAVKDILVFVPSLEDPLKGNQQAVLRLNGKLSGHLKDLHIPYLEMGGLGNSSMAVSGLIRGLPDGKRAFYDLHISKLKTSRTDLSRFIPEKYFPVTIRIPEDISVNGKFTGSFNRFFTDLHTTTKNGDADISGTLDLDKKSYDLSVATQAADFGYIFRQDSLLGKVTLKATAKGSGFDPKKMNSVFHVNAEEFNLKSYNYKGLMLDANLQNGHASIHSSMQDVNISYRLNAETQFLEKYPVIQMNLQLDTVNALALHWLKDSVQLHIQLKADFKSTDPDALNGQLRMTDIGMTIGSTKFHTDSILMQANHTDTGQLIRLHSELADIRWAGKYKITQVPESIKQYINHYYKIPVAIPDSTEAEQWEMDLHFKPSPLLLVLMPDLEGTDTLSGHVRFNSTNKNLNLDFRAAKIQYKQQVIHQFRLQADTRDQVIHYRVSVADAGERSFHLNQSSLYGALAENKISATLLVKDNKSKNRYMLSGILSPLNRGYHFVFNPDSLLLDYESWKMPADNYIQYDSSGLLVHNLEFQHQTESITFNTKGETTSSPLDLSFTRFKIKTITQLMEQDSLLLDGTINGNAEVRNLFTKPLFTSDIKIENLAYDKDTLGNLVIQVNNEELNAYKANIILKGNENDLHIDGKYFSGESKMDMNINLVQLNLASFKSMVFSQVRGLKGFMKGNLHAIGNLDKPVLTGYLQFENAGLTPVITGEPLKVLNDKIIFDESGLNFDHFTMLDSAGNKATIDGNVFTKDYKKYHFDLSFKLENFQVVNAPKATDRSFYGSLNLNTEINLSGNQDQPKVTALLRVNKKTNFFVVLPSDDPEVEDRQGVVIFTSNKPAIDSVFRKKIRDSLNAKAGFKGMDIAATIETDSSALFTLIVDERNGDALSMRGMAELTGSIDKTGKMRLTGNYELKNGSYNLTLSVLKRDFTIQRGSTVTWTGDPTQAFINITAIYIVTTAPIDLMQQQVSSMNSDEANKYKQRLPFQVKLNMSGELLKPTIRFDIVLSESYTAMYPEVETKLQQLRSDDAEMNKQVFALLLLGRFVAENPFQSASGASDASVMARQSASRLMTDQLNQLAGSLVKGVDLSFDMNSYQNYTTGNGQNQTQLNVKVSKNLFNERVRVSVGSDFQLEGANTGQDATNIAGDVDIDYRISKDGRYMIRVYRKDQYDTVVQGQVVETGLSFILTLDYEKFRELFVKKKDNQPGSSGK